MICMTSTTITAAQSVVSSRAYVVASANLQEVLTKAKTQCYKMFAIDLSLMILLHHRNA